MDKIIIQLTNSKAYKLLQDMEELDLIKVLKEPANISSLRGKIRSPMSNDAINKQIKTIRKEWKRTT